MVPPSSGATALSSQHAARSATGPSDGAFGSELGQQHAFRATSIVGHQKYRWLCITSVASTATIIAIDRAVRDTRATTQTA